MNSDLFFPLSAVLFMIASRRSLFVSLGVLLAWRLNCVLNELEAESDPQPPSLRLWFPPSGHRSLKKARGRPWFKPQAALIVLITMTTKVVMYVGRFVRADFI